MHLHEEDPYSWLEDLDNPDTKEFIKRENKRTRDFLRDLSSKFRGRLEELYSARRIDNVAQTSSGLFMFVREGPERSIVRRFDDGEEEVLISSRDLPRDSVLTSEFWVSSNGNKLAYKLSLGGSDEGEVRIVDLDENKIVEKINGWLTRVIFLPDRCFYERVYVKEKTPDGIKPPTSRVVERVDGKEVVVFGEGVETSRFATIVPSTDGKYAMGWIGDWGSSEVHVGELKTPLESKKIYDGKGSQTSPIDVVDEEMYILSYEEGGFGKLVKVNLSTGKTENVLEENPKELGILKDVIIVDGTIFAHYEKDASSRLRKFKLDGSMVGEERFEGVGTITSMSTDGKTGVVVRETFSKPFELYNLNSYNKRLLMEETVGEDGDIEVLEEFIPSKDGTPVHIFYVKKKGQNPENVVAYVYGGFSYSITPRFNPFVISLLEEGHGYVVANVRGGNEYGESWHRDGMKENKQNVFNDYLAVVEEFKRRGYRVIGKGESNGGLVVAASVVQNPRAFDGALIGYPLLDLLKFYKFPVGESWISELGDPRNTEEKRFLEKYSPYHNIHPTEKYPPTLVYTGINDDRVHPSHALKFTAKLENYGNPVYLRVCMGSGHRDATYEARIDETSDLLAFIEKVFERR
ncbi:MAG: S9 family peptidase [Candidatus Aenigmarchaeota archaeon]|nr:S9 family peptidase [Candidatus Aenigmarchaeota archaeon]